MCLGSFKDELLTINNTGTCPLSIFDIASSDPNFQAPSVVFYPLIVNPGTSIDLTIRFQPLNLGLQGGIISIFSSDPASPATVSVFGFAPAPTLSLVIADTGDFGKVCVGRFVDEPLILSNSGMCTLTIFGISSS